MAECCVFPTHESAHHVRRAALAPEDAVLSRCRAVVIFSVREDLHIKQLHPCSSQPAHAAQSEDLQAKDAGTTASGQRPLRATKVNHGI